MKAWRQAAAAVVAISLLTGCSMFKSESEQTNSGGGKSTSDKGSGDVKAQNTNGNGGGQKPSVIDQELHKQFQIYKEIIDYQLQQQRQVQQQSEQRYKELKKQSDKPSKPGKGGVTGKINGSTFTGSGESQEKQGSPSDRNGNTGQ